MNNNKKPTNKDLVKVINGLIQEIEFLHHQVMSITTIMNLFVEFTGKAKEFEIFAKAKMKERAEKEAKIKEKLDDTQTDGTVD